MYKPKSLTSVSGGRTSSYLALHYPTDYNIFSLVRIEDKACAPKDKKLIQYVEDKIKMPFIATAESDLTLYVLQQLEQDLGKEIIWVTGKTFEQLIFERRGKPNLPNRRMRFCTTEMKLEPIFWWVYLNLFDSEDDFVEMNIGYRADEPSRSADDFFEFSYMCNNFGERHNNFKTLEWRSCKFPLQKNSIFNIQIKSYFAKLLKYKFPKESNCTGCFNKDEITLHNQFIEEPLKMNWFNNMEKKTDLRFNFYSTLEEIKNKDYGGVSLDMFSDSFTTCNCHD